MIYIFFRTLTMVISALETAAFIYCVLSWIAPQTRIYEILSFLMEPFVRPFRPLGEWVMQRIGLPLDFSFMFFILALYIIQRLAYTLYVALI